MRISGRMIVAASIAALLSGTVQAQGFDELIVTAQKREQALQEVALAVTAINSESIETRGIVDFSSYLRTVPSASLQELGTLGNEVKIRGVGNGTAEVSPTTSVYLGEVPIIHTGRGVNSSYNFWTVDLERIEVLRGPQGQLYGSNSLGGAIRNLPAKPVMNETQIRGSVTGANTDDGDWSGNADLTLNVPLVDDSMALRVTGYAARLGGWYDNV